MKIALAGIFLIACAFLVPAHAGSAKTALTGALAERFNAVSDRLVCQCGCQMILGVCNHQNCPSGIPMRHDIERQLRAGASDDAIVDDFVARRGKAILSSPPAKGAYVLAWILPFAVLAAGGMGVVWWLRKQNKGVEQSAKPPAALNPEEEEKFKKEWNRWNRQS